MNLEKSADFECKNFHLNDINLKKDLILYEPRLSLGFQVGRGRGAGAGAGGPGARS